MTAPIRSSGASLVAKSISTGIAGIDFLLGGGVSGGAIILIQESKSTCGYADVCAKLFLAEALYRKNRIYFASDGTVSCSEFLQTLPQAVLEESTATERSDESISSRNMEIAFRYEHLPVTNMQISSDRRRQQHSFDLSRPISGDDLRSYKHLTTYDARYQNSSRRHFDVMLEQLKHSLFNPQSSDDHDDARWHRIFVRNFGSPLWQSSCEQKRSDFEASVIDFLASLRAYLRQKATAVALITVTAALVDDDGPMMQRIRQMADVVLRLDPIDIGEKEKTILDYHGHLRCLRTPSINSISYPTPDCADYAFKLKKKEFLIERLHLPPDLSETVSRNQLDSFSCSSSSSRSKLDF